MLIESGIFFPFLIKVKFCGACSRKAETLLLLSLGAP
jgi:hypothetical protein